MIKPAEFFSLCPRVSVCVMCWSFFVSRARDYRVSLADLHIFSTGLCMGEHNK